MLNRTSKRKREYYTLEELKEKMLLLKRKEQIYNAILLCLISAELVVICMIIKQETSVICLIDVVEKLIISMVILLVLIVLAFIRLCKIQNHYKKVRNEAKYQIWQKFEENIESDDFETLKVVAQYLKEFNIK